MFVLSRDVSAAKRVIATLLATALVLWASGAFSFRAQAADLANVSDTLSDSSPGADSDHTIVFTLVNDLSPSQSVVVDMPDTFDFTGVTSGDVGISNVNFGAAIIGTATSSITFFNTGSTIASGTVITIAATGTNKINNPDNADDPNVSNTINGNESYEIVISAGTSDSGRTRVVILDTVLVTANVESVFNFVVNGLPAGTTVNGTTTQEASSSTTIPFGTLTSYTKKTIAQNLTVETNALNGFVVTVQTDGHLESSNGAIIDNFEDANTPTAWVSPSVGLNIADNTTWGFWGVTTEDNDTDGMRDGDEFAAEEFIGVTTTPRAIFAHDGPADAVTTSIGSTTVGYQVEISPLQEAANDYQTTLTYIATPTF